jgi:DUF438 domain-containing protein
MKIKRYLELRPYQKYPKDSPEFQLYLKFVTEFQNDNNSKDLLSKFEIDTNYIKNNTEKLLELYSNEENIAWNTQQKEFIFKEKSLMYLLVLLSFNNTKYKKISMHILAINVAQAEPATPQEKYLMKI